MATADGTYTIGPAAGRLVVNTARTGLGARAGHDLTIEVTRWRGTAVVDTSDAGASSVAVEAEVGSFEVREGTGGVKPLTGSDRAEIRDIIAGRILDARRHPMIVFQSSRVTGNADAFRLDGDLTIAGVTHPVAVTGTLSGGRARGSAQVRQSHWGIKPYTAFFGALRLRDEVEVEFDVGLAR